TADCVGRPVAELLRRRSHALRDPLEDRRPARMGWPRRRPRLQGADAPRQVAGRSARRPIRSGLLRTPFHLSVPAPGRAGSRDRQPDHAGGDAHWLGLGRYWRVPRPYGRLREAKWTARFRLHGRDQAVPAPDRLSTDAARDGAELAGGRRMCREGHLRWKAGVLYAPALERSFRRLRVARISTSFRRLNSSSADYAGVPS